MEAAYAEDFAAGFAMGEEIFNLIGTPNQVESVTAYFEKRAPNYAGLRPTDHAGAGHRGLGLPRQPHRPSAAATGMRFRFSRLQRKPSGFRDDGDRRVRDRRGDITDRLSVEAAVVGCDASFMRRRSLRSNRPARPRWRPQPGRCSQCVGFRSGGGLRSGDPRVDIGGAFPVPDGSGHGGSSVVGAENGYGRPRRLQRYAARFRMRNIRS